MPTPTPVLGLQAAVATDLEPDYLVTSLAASLNAIDVQFDPTLGHNHMGAANGGSMPTYVHEEYVPLAAATTVTLTQTPLVVLMVARDGLVQSAVVPHYTVAGAVLTFANDFDGAERVIVAYSYMPPVVLADPAAANGNGRRRRRDTGK